MSAPEDPLHGDRAGSLERPVPGVTVHTVTDLPPVLSIGAVGGGATDGGAAERAVKRLGNAVMAAREGVQSSLNVNVVYLIAGRYLSPEFSGARTGRYSARQRHLLVQVALVPTDGVHPDEQVHELLRVAVVEAERWAQERRVAVSLPELRDLVDRVTAR